jgi:hypothetical protein
MGCRRKNLFIYNKAPVQVIEQGLYRLAHCQFKRPSTTSGIVIQDRILKTGDFWAYTACCRRAGILL